MPLATTPSLDDLTLTVAEEIRIDAPIEDAFAALLDQIGPHNETPNGDPMPMKLEAHPGGRWYRDLGDDNGHLLGPRAGDQTADVARDQRAALHVVRGLVERAISAGRIRRGNGADVSSFGVRLDSR